MPGLTPNMLRRDGGFASTGRRVRPASLGTAVWALLLLAGCSQQERDSDGEAAPRVAAASEPGDAASQTQRFDKEAAAALSITRTTGAEFESDYARAVACTSAIHVLTATVRGLSVNVGAAELRTLARAEQVYLEDAERYGRVEGVSEAEVGSDISEAIEVGSRSAADQARLGVTCLQNLDS